MSTRAAAEADDHEETSDDRVIGVESAPEPPGGARAWLVWGVAVGVYFLAMFHRNGLSVAALETQERFHVGPALLSVLPMLQLVVYVLLQVPAGILADRVGPRRTLLFGLAAMTCGVALFALAPNVQAAVAGRVLIGLGDAVTFINVIRLAALWFPRRRYALVSALTGTAGGLGQIASVGPLSAALHGPGWVAAFLGSAAVTAVMTLLVLLVVADSPTGPPGRRGTRQPVALRASVAEAFCRSGPRAGMAHHAAVMAPYTMLAVLWGYPFLVEGVGLTPAAAGAAMTALGAGTLWIAPTLGAVVGRRPGIRRPFATVFATVLSAGWITVVVWPGGPPPAPVSLAVLTVSSAGAMIAPSLSFDFARDGVPAHRTGVVSSVVNMSGFTTTVVATVAAGLILQAGAGYQLAFLPITFTTVGASALLITQLWRSPRG
ncbi:cyanate permease [Haloactinospora alba]|uniref:Cyanate permease n=1 Tax=Haloactinospora alba TaxID=405555 RepID=A0A543NAE0_9ACTN|nr:MFS transporter [Haloactinospora alba]TQN28812.1 cyanate permease [Haloactinospora alba]